MSTAHGLLVVLSGPSGVGKSTVAARLLEDPLYARAVTATTRAPRPGERDGVDYHFLTPEEFEARLRRGEFLEHARVHGRLYGTPRAAVADVLASGRVCVLVIDVQGAATLRHAAVEGLFVFLAPPSEADLLARLRGRATESEAELSLRVQNALREELPRRSEFHHVVVNDDLAHAVAEIRLLVSARRAAP